MIMKKLKGKNAMKKLVSLLLVFALLLSCTSSLADLNTAAATEAPADGTVSGEVYFSFGKMDFLNVFNSMKANMGLNATWSKDPLDTFGYPMYYCSDDTESIYTIIHDNGGVIGIEVDVFTTIEQLESDLDYLQNIGSFFAIAHHSVYILENPDITSDDILAVNGLLQAFMMNINHMGETDDEGVYTEEIGGLMTRLSWDLGEEEITIYFSVLPVGSER